MELVLRLLLRLRPASLKEKPIVQQVLLLWKGMLMVKQIRSADYPSLAEALKNLPESVLKGEERLRLELAPGIYREKLFLTVPKLEIAGTGDDPSDCIIRYDDGALGKDKDGEALGTFRTPTLYAESDTLLLENLTIENSAGPGRVAGQAVALALNCREATIQNCCLKGDQDTLFLAPLPPSAVLDGGFRGTEKWRRRSSCRSHFIKTSVEGGVDFIFGGGEALFEDCLLRSLRPSDIAERKRGESLGYITAASTPEDQERGLIFYRCRLISDCPPASVYLGRPWRDHAKTVWIACEMGDHIRPEGWHDWHKEEARRKSFYAEYKSLGPGACPEARVSWSRPLDAAAAEKILKGFRQAAERAAENG